MLELKGVCEKCKSIQPVRKLTRKDVRNLDFEELEDLDEISSIRGFPNTYIIVRHSIEGKRCEGSGWVPLELVQ